MVETVLKPIAFLPEVISDNAIFLVNLFHQVTWFTFIMTLTVTYFLLRSLLWQWRLGNYAHRYVLVTGCDSGFGLELVRRLDSLGFRVFAGCLTSEGTDHVTKVTTRRVMPLTIDVTNIDNIRQVVDQMTSTIPSGSGLWAVVNNAGILPSMAPLELTPRDCFQRTLAVNLMGVVEVTRACLPLVRRSSGRIVNMSSVSGRLGFTSIDYTASKFALEGFSDCLRRELYPEGIQVSTITPGGFRTSLCNFDKIFVNMQCALDSSPPEVQKHFGKDYVTSLNVATTNVATKLECTKIPSTLCAACWKPEATISEIRVHESSGKEGSTDETDIDTSEKRPRQPDLGATQTLPLITPEELKRAQEQDPTIGTVIQFWNKGVRPRNEDRMGKNTTFIVL
ncbi:hypothetical protein ACOMHN_033204 [Nucella lapillus]